MDEVQGKKCAVVRGKVVNSFPTYGKKMSIMNRKSYKESSQKGVLEEKEIGRASET